jgi:hypothetical protein
MRRKERSNNGATFLAKKQSTNCVAATGPPPLFHYKCHEFVEFQSMPDPIGGYPWLRNKSHSMASHYNLPRQFGAPEFLENDRSIRFPE